MKTKLFVSFAAFVAASALMCSCSNEESADYGQRNRLYKTVESRKDVETFVY